MIELYVVGNRIVFHKYLIECNLSDEIREKVMEKAIEKLGKYRIENYGILCDDDNELNTLSEILKEFGISYTVKDISPPPEVLAKAMEIDGKVGSRTQALNYILKGEVPPSLRLEMLEKEVKELKKRAI